jgi:hypothetical protein
VYQHGLGILNDNDHAYRRLLEDNFHRHIIKHIMALSLDGVDSLDAELLGRRINEKD